MSVDEKKSPKILVIGATGNVGSVLVNALNEKNSQIRVASRSGKSISGLEGVVFDFLKPETFEPAFEGVDAAYVLLPGGYVQSKELFSAVFAVAAKSKVKVVMQSAMGVDADDNIPYRQAEIALEKSGLPYVILRPNWFADNFHSFWKAGIDRGQIALPAGEGKSSFIDIRDIANCAVEALISNKFDNHAFDLTGPKAYSYAEAATLISEKLGKEISYSAISDESFINAMISFGIPADYSNFLASIFYPVREGWTSKVTDSVEKILGRQPYSLTDYLDYNLDKLK